MDRVVDAQGLVASGRKGYRESVLTRPHVEENGPRINGTWVGIWRYTCFEGWWIDCSQEGDNDTFIPRGPYETEEQAWTVLLMLKD